MFSYYAALVKFSAFMFKRTKLSWKHAFVFSLMSVSTLLVMKSFIFITGFSPPDFIFLTFSLTFQMGLGGWYLGRKAESNRGLQIPFWNGAAIVAITGFITTILGLIVFAAFPPR